MKKFEIKPNKINLFIKNIRNNKNFLAMAVTMPYKKMLAQKMDYLDDFSRKTNSINLVVKKEINYGVTIQIFLEQLAQLRKI